MARLYLYGSHQPLTLSLRHAAGPRDWPVCTRLSVTHKPRELLDPTLPRWSFLQLYVGRPIFTNTEWHSVAYLHYHTITVNTITVLPIPQCPDLLPIRELDFLGQLSHLGGMGPGPLPPPILAQRSAVSEIMYLDMSRIGGVNSAVRNARA